MPKPMNVTQLVERAKNLMDVNDPHRGDVVGSPWFREFVSKEVSQVTNFSESECRTLCKKSGIEYLSGYESRIVQFKYTDGTIDRYGDKIIAKGVKLDKYKTNPVILGFHDSHTFPIGASLKVWYEKSDDSVKGWVLFLDDRVDQSGFADSMFRMVKAGIVKTGSIGFIPSKFRRPDEDERKSLGMGEYGYLFEEVELIEFSIVPLPANPSAIMEPITKGLITARAMDTINEKKLFSAEDTVNIRTAWDMYLLQNPVRIGSNEGNNEEAGVFNTTDSADPRIVANDVGRSAPSVVMVPANSSGPLVPRTLPNLIFNLPIKQMSKDSIESAIASAKSYGSDFNVTINVGDNNQKDTDLSEIYALVRDIKTKTLLTKEQKNVIQDCVTHVTALMECLQELLDASSAEETDEGDGTGKSTTVTQQVPLEGEKSVNELYSPDFLQKVDKRMNEIKNLGKGK